MVTPIKRWTLLIELRVESTPTSPAKEERRLFRIANGQTFQSALKLDEIGAKPGEEPRWFLSESEAENAQLHVMPAAKRALTYWLVEHHNHRKSASLAVTVTSEDDARRMFPPLWMQ